ncbi:MAG: hypothetical protein QM778_24090 [Myxococcales bacterium]
MSRRAVRTSFVMLAGLLAALLTCASLAKPAGAQVSPGEPGPPAPSAPAAESSSSSTTTTSSTATADPVPDGVRMSGFLQVDAVTYQQSSIDELDPGSRQPLNEDRFVIRRARLRADARHGLVSGSVVLDANTINGPQVRLFSAEASVGYPKSVRPHVQATLGLFLIPFGFETTEQANRRLFLEPSNWVRALFPGRRDLGARIAGEWSFLRYALAVMNGNPSESASLPERDPNRAKDFVGRVGAGGELFQKVALEIGVSGLWGKGFHPGAAPTKDTVVFRDANEDGLVQPTELQRMPGNPGDASQNFERFGLGGDAALSFEWPVLGRGRLYGELVWANNLDRALYPADPVALGRNLRELGVMLGVRQEITRHLELGARYDSYDPDRDANDRQGARLVVKDASYGTLAVALAWCTLPFARVTLEYDHQKNPLGRSQSGKPTTLAMDSLTLRGQVEF